MNPNQGFINAGALIMLVEGVKKVDAVEETIFTNSCLSFLFY